MDTSSFIYGILPEGAREMARVMLAFLQKKSALPVEAGAEFNQAVEQLDRSGREELFEYLIFLNEQFGSARDEQLAQSLSNMLHNVLQKLPDVQYRLLEQSLQQMNPSAEALVMLKPGSAFIEDENVSNMSVFIAVSGLQSVSTNKLPELLASILRLAPLHQLHLLEHILSEFIAEANGKPCLSSMPPVSIGKGKLAFQFTLSAEV